MKKIIALGITVLFLLISLAGCNGENSVYNPANNQVADLGDTQANIQSPNTYLPHDLPELDYSKTYETVPFSDSNNEYSVSVPAPPMVEASWLPFEQTLAEFTTDVVIVQYVGHRQFGEHSTEFEFIVLERILGNAADRIFVYAELANDDGRPAPTSAHISSLGLNFNHGVNYLLPLIMITHPQANTHDDGFTFVQYSIFDLDNPLNSVVLGRQIYQALFTSLNIDDNISKQDIVSFVAELTKDNPPARDIIRSDAIEDIVTGSRYIVAVEINRPLRLSDEQRTTDFAATDLYYVTALRTLKGDFIAPDGFLIIFPANTVSTGERHIVAIEPISEGSSWFRFTARNSLFTMDQHDEIMRILR